ncbi:uncharacterized protein LOC127249341 [Andrographis paniculata]|uniref:uncharacterized protein LOC127249341 n=1 Tax=Andrographis paniculata TaxID=175694 RepID=UPI0021E810DA|nr:uncharacterized protein LOC127249341 [Andrographis paniculata]
MGTEVLWPQDLLGERLRGPHASSFQRRRNFPANGNLTKLVVNRRANNGRKTSPRGEKKRSNVDNGAATNNKPETRRKDENGGGGAAGKAIGRVTLLRRGESLDSLISKKRGGRNPNPNPRSKPQPVDDLAVLGTGRIGPESPEMMPNKILLSPPPSLPPPPPRPVYAGSAFSLSPSPKSLPLPSFFNKKQQNGASSTANSATDSATRDLRRLLRLD